MAGRNAGETHGRWNPCAMKKGAFIVALESICRTFFIAMASL